MAEARGQGLPLELCNNPLPRKSILEPKWFKPRNYRHLDVPVSAGFAKFVEDPKVVAAHSFLPHFHYIKKTRRYRAELRKTEFKERPIMYPSHRDGCILSLYASRLNEALEARYAAAGLSEAVIAYRKLAKGNYDFAKEVHDAATAMSPCSILCFDVTKFFDTLDHRLLKARLKNLLGVAELGADWYAVFRQVTRFSFVKIEDLKAIPEIAVRFTRCSKAPVATIAELKLRGVAIKQNPDKFGIPQGTPISSALSNLYMIDFDAKLLAFCNSIGGLYRRYADDILVVCPPAHAAAAEALVTAALGAEKLAINPDKTERKTFSSLTFDQAQYLGFRLFNGGARIRESSLSRQWRKLRRSVRRTARVGQKAMDAGKATKIFTQKLRKRFGAHPVRNFSSYARRSANSLKSKLIIRQVRRLEKELDRLVDELCDV